ncbi:MAG: Glu/Leu/Phe/Val dehydrogenase [Dehalococcoidia bacterium]|nr:Glu/Leu/Phe/Val dehydrogenase [Dehalococcoidia bacterium]
MSSKGYEELVFWNDDAVGLHAILAIHCTVLGPALGGIRMYPYKDEENAVRDVLRLARAMTYKNSAAGLDFGGGKAVIIGDPASQKSEGLFRSFGRFVQSLGGRYITTTDVGTYIEDLLHIRAETKFVAGLPENMGGSGGTSMATAVGIISGMKVCARHALGSSTLSGLTVAVQGLGKVGGYLVEHLVEAGAKVVVTDVNAEAVQETKDRYSVDAVSPDHIFSVECDIFSPNALGGVINWNTILQLRCAIVAGGANNQLGEDADGRALHEKGILYAPDYVINAGGVINCAEEMAGYNRERAFQRVERIGEAVERVLVLAKKENIPTAEAANRLAQERIRTIAQIHKGFIPEYK